MRSDPDKLQIWQTLSNDLAFETKWFKIHKKHMQTPGRKELDYYIHDAPDSVICVCVSEDSKILIEQQYRPPVDKVSFDYPAGSVDADDTSTEGAIRRELQEEAGFTVLSIKKLAVIDKDPAFSQARMHVFLAKGAIDSVATPEETESIVANFVSPMEILELITSGKISCVFCLSATLLAFKELGWLTVSVPAIQRRSYAASVIALRMASLV